LTLSGADSYSTHEVGNELSGLFNRTTSGGGSDMLSESGSIAGLPYNSTPSTGYTLSETGNDLSGELSLTETGSDRYSLIYQFDNASNAVLSNGNGPGDVDYSPVGLPFHVGQSPYWGHGVNANLDAAASDAAFSELGLGLLHECCWAGETPLTLSTGNDQPIESSREGQFVLSASDRDPEGPRHESQIGQFFKNGLKHVIELEVEGHVCRPTPNHPLYVRDRGFVPAGELRPGDELLTDDHRWVKVTSIVDTGEVVPVFNLMVVKDHTYFIGSRHRWGFCFLVHNDSAEAEDPRYKAGVEPSPPSGGGVAPQRDWIREQQIEESGRTAEEFAAAEQAGLAANAQQTAANGKALQEAQRSSSSPGGALNPLNAGRALYAGDANAPDQVYADAKNGGGKNYTQNAGNAHTGLKMVSDWDPTGVAAATDATLTKLEGKELHDQAMKNTDPRLHKAAEVNEKLATTVEAVKTITQVKNSLTKRALGVAEDQAGKAAGKTGRSIDNVADTGAHPQVPGTGRVDTGAHPSVPGTGAVDTASQGSSRANQVKVNKAKGDAWEDELLKKELPKTQSDVQPQITIKSNGPSGKKVRLDAVGKEKVTDDIKLTDGKASDTAGLTPNQKVVYPELERHGGTVVGKGKPPYDGGTKIPPTKVDIIRPSNP
jgi:hypothetical protein